MSKITDSISSLTVVLALAGCGGSSPTPPPATATTATGIFKDSNTSGLSYTSGSQTGVTTDGGKFTYEVGQPVTFKIGAVTLGSVNIGKSTVTPLDLVEAAASSSSASVQNMVRFLTMLDTDNIPENGITVSSAVQSAATLWSQLNFDVAEANFTNAVSGIQATVNLADNNRTSVLRTAAEAKAHLEATLRCAYAGGYKGTYSGTDNGQFGVVVDAVTGAVSGIVYTMYGATLNPPQPIFIASGTTPIDYDKNAGFVTGNVTLGTIFSGKYTSVNGLTGTWSNTSLAASGTFSGARLGGADNALYRFTGQYNGSDTGLLTVDIDNTDTVSGYGYSVLYNNQFTITGTFNPTTGLLDGTTSTGGTFSATLDTATGSISFGTWTNTTATPVATGEFTGSGCKLN